VKETEQRQRAEQEEQQKQKEQKEQKQQEKNTSKDGNKVDIAYREFVQHVSKWSATTIQVDANIVRAANDQCERAKDEFDISPWNISPTKLQAVMVPLARRLYDEDYVASMPCLISDYQQQLQPFSSHNSKSEQRSDYRQVFLDIVGIRCRWSVLRCMNDRVLAVFPFVDLSNTFNNPLASSPYESWDGSAVSRSFVGRAMCDARRLLFLSPKKYLLRTALDRTVTRAKKAEDDYDYPEDLSTVVLNRPKAVLAKSLPDPETRLSYSVFGQAFDELHFLEPSALRMAYTHPMDDGQERTFKVKFEGEGVDDYGGPYREFFSTICAELQGLNPDLDDDDDIECVLPLFIPAPNQKRRTGENQAHFIINPKTGRLDGGSSQLYLEMYNFLGQFLGIALRSNVHLDLSLPSIVWKSLVGEPLGWDDFEMFDSSSCHVLRELVALCEAGELDSVEEIGGESELIQEILDELSWCATTSDGQEIDVRSGISKSLSSSDADDGGDMASSDSSRNNRSREGEGGEER
jgi:hypothetical protein